MKAKSRQPGLTLTEMVVVIATIGLLVVLGVPAVRAFLNSFESRSGARSVISAALASARAIAAKEQRYAGIRFQKAYHPEDTLEAPQYMIFIVQDPEIGAYFFRAVEGLKPIKLPDSVGVMDSGLIEEKVSFIPSWELSGDPAELTDLTAFSIIFSPSGKMVIHNVQVRNKDGERDTMANINETSEDDVFNKKDRVKKDRFDTKRAMFCQDDYYGGLDNPYGDLGLGPEQSRNSFIIYDKIQFDETNVNSKWSDYLRYLEVIYINHYTGTMISAD